MKTIKDVSNKEIRDFLGCKVVHASHIRSGLKAIPRKKILEFSKKFNIPIESLIENKRV